MQTPGIDPRLNGSGAYLWSSIKTRDRELEEARRFNIGFEWSYSPSQVNGDWYAEEADWVVEQGYFGDLDCHTPQVTGTYQGSHVHNVDRFADNGHTAAKMYYVIIQLCEAELLKEKHPDSY